MFGARIKCLLLRNIRPPDIQRIQSEMSIIKWLHMTVVSDLHLFVKTVTYMKLQEYLGFLCPNSEF